MKTTNFTSTSVNYLLLILMLGGVMSCTKDKIGDTFYVEGRVLEYGTGNPVPNASVFLWAASGEFLGPVSKTRIDTVTTNEKGEYSIKYINTIDAKFSTAIGANYFNSGEFDMVSTERQKLDIIIDPYAWLRVKIIHEGPIGDYDRVVMRYQSCSPEFNHIQNRETEILCIREGNRTHNLEYSKTPTSQASERIDFSLYLPGHDTTEYVIKF